LSTAQHRSPIFELADEIIEIEAASNPLFATSAGIEGYDHLLPDFSPERTLQDIKTVRSTLSKVDSLVPIDDIDEVAAAVIKERLGVQLSLLEKNEIARLIGVIGSPLSDVRQIFELMGQESVQDHANITSRLTQVRPALESWKLSLLQLKAAGQLPPRRHIVGLSEQAKTYGEGTFQDFAVRVAPEDSTMKSAATDADEATRSLGAWISSELVDSATTRDGAGKDRYKIWAQYFTGAEIDLQEFYEWGWNDLKRINKRMWEIAEIILPGAKSLSQVAQALDTDPKRTINGTNELLRRLISFTEGAVEALDGVHFDIDERIKFCDARLAPAGGAAAPYYNPPSEDLSRPGTTWYPTLGRTSFTWWREASTWYHEGVPGHHLQIATSIIEKDRQSRYQRLDGGTSGCWEGWALYAERLMEELGFFSDLGDEMGYLANQALRAARVVVDIGMHLELNAPSDLGNLSELGDCGAKKWTAEMAVAVLEERALQSHEMSISEIDRYLSWPGQAISYKLGERVILRAREDAMARLGEKFSLKKFHAFTLKLGSMGLDPFENELKKWNGA
jgi:uncharacterized protein (DUF885 family)